MLAALIPVKDLTRAKARLAPVLDEQGRRDLVVAMYLDVVEAATNCPALNVVCVVTHDEEARQLATETGAEALDDTSDLNGSLDAAAQTMLERGHDRVLVLHADLPFANSDDLQVVATSPAEVALVAAGDGGTNALACPAGAFGFRFGPGSAQEHRQAAWDADLEPELLDLPNLALDIDTPADLERVHQAIDAGRSTGSHTISALVSLGFVAEPGRTRP